MSNLRFYMDESVDPKVADQLKRRGIDAVSVRDLDLLGDTDINHLERAAQMQRVLCTHDRDFIVLAKEIEAHAGIVFAPHFTASVGGWVRALVALHAEQTAEQMINMVRYVSAK